MWKVKEGNHYFAGGEPFETKKEIADTLISYHDNDFTGTDDDENELSMEEYLKYHNITTEQERLDWVLEYGLWELEEVKEFYVDFGSWTVFAKDEEEARSSAEKMLLEEVPSFTVSENK